MLGKRSGFNKNALRVLPAAGIALAGVALAACGAPASLNTGVDSAKTHQSSANEVQRCHSSMLTGSLRPGSPGAGQRYADLVLRNQSSQPCTIYGYSGLQLVDSTGHLLPTTVTRSNPGPQPVTLNPGQSSVETLHWTAVATGDEPISGPCEPQPASVQVIPPDETNALTVSWNSMGEVCDHGRFDSSAFAAG